MDVQQKTILLRNHLLLLNLCRAKVKPVIVQTTFTNCDYLM
jgi:hypothetical protein